MTKPRDEHGNDFIAVCGWIAFQLFHARFKRLPDPKSASDTATARKLTDDFYAVAIKHWKEWEPEK